MVDKEERNGIRIDQIFHAIQKRRWLIIVSAVSVVLVSMGILFSLPNKYTSEATLIVVQQKVPERYVVPTSNANVADVLDAMVRDVLSRPKLVGIVRDVGVYPGTALASDEELFSRAYRDVEIEALNNRANSFKISFSADTPQVAQEVTNRLTTLFIEQNLKTRADQAATTTGFLREQLEETRRKLAEQEQRLRDYKLQFTGELPEQQQGNLTILGSVESQLDNVMSARTQAQQQRLYLESLLSERRRISRRSSGSVPGLGVDVPTALDEAKRHLIRLQAEKQALLAKYKSQHPDVEQKEQEIRVQQSLIENWKAPPTTTDSPKGELSATADAEDDLGATQLKSQLQANSLELENLENRERKLRADVDLYRRRLNITPTHEQQLTSLQRDYDLIRQHYGDLLKKEQESQMATTLEKRQEGQQFRLVDPPNLPSRPSSPKRLKLSLAAILGGLILGTGLAVVLEGRLSPFYDEKALSAEFAVPLVVGVPLFRGDSEQTQRVFAKGLEWTAAAMLLVCVVAAEYYVYLHG